MKIHSRSDLFSDSYFCANFVVRVRGNVQSIQTQHTVKGAQLMLSTEHGENKHDYIKIKLLINQKLNSD